MAPREEHQTPAQQRSGRLAIRRVAAAVGSPPHVHPRGRAARALGPRSSRHGSTPGRRARQRRRPGNGRAPGRAGEHRGASRPWPPRRPGAEHGPAQVLVRFGDRSLHVLARRLPSRPSGSPVERTPGASALRIRDGRGCGHQALPIVSMGVCLTPHSLRTMGGVLGNREGARRRLVRTWGSGDPRIEHAR